MKIMHQRFFVRLFATVIMVRRFIMNSELTVINQEFLTGERALFKGHDLHITNTVFDDGESPLKHSNNIKADNCLFRWKYPFWYSNNIELTDCSFFKNARAGMWYTNNISLKDCLIEAPKEFRRCNEVSLSNVSFADAKETLWECSNVRLNDVTVKGAYFGMNCENVVAYNLVLYGDYCFDGAKNVEVYNSKFLSKDCFWNAENITIYDSFISGEYLAWNSKNIKLVNCTIESLQGMCYIDNLVLENCKLINTTLAFEYSSVEADITSKIDSVMNPCSGTIKADSIGKLILEKDMVDTTLTKIYVREGEIDG